MIDFLYSIDKTLFYFFNWTIANPVFDAVMPLLTDWNKSWVGLGLFGAIWLLLLWKGGKKGRIIGILVIPLIFMSDQVSSTLIKPIVARPRPCHEMNGVPVLDHLRLLVPCGSGYSFPSSHAVNNFAFAAFFSSYYRNWAWLFYLYAVLMGLSRMVVGVHYPSDVLGGALIGIMCSMTLTTVWELLAQRYPVLSIDEPLQ
ncbi:MAG: phosphatase PAP2 family protein [Ignavibacteria bacterium]|nr:phosphatase PAP2 family protein [Ignavibacteria bacterium]